MATCVDVYRILGLLILMQFEGHQFANVNVAVNQPASQDHTLQYGGFNWTADKAVDGNLQRDEPGTQKSCSCSDNKEGNYWRMDFDQTCVINTITVYGRNDSNEGQLPGFKLYIIEPGDSKTLIYNDTGKDNPADAVYNYTLDPAQVNAIVIERNSHLLTVCEVQAYECSDGSYGAGCAGCGNCKGNTACNKINGQCPQGCEPGWRNVLCDQPCDTDTYGDKCNFTCGHCARNGTCDHFNGSCGAEGCDAGWKGDTCHDVCMNGTYGDDCTSACGHCAGNGACHHVYGKCGAGGCDAGWQGNMCHHACDNGTYGDNCNFTCGNCAKNGTCDYVHGGCVDGCSTGWQGDTCHDACENGTYGVNCSSTCGSCAMNETCYHIDGICADGCAAGWKGDTCNDACENGTYGVNCSSTCGNCAINETCYPVDGICADGCAAGWKGDTCNDACDNRTYGDNCASTCGNCARNDTCQHVEGVCVDGCAAGWKGDTCQDVCPEYTYGDMCTVRCGNCAANESCDHVTGVCDEGCTAGWQGTLCDHACSHGIYGELCAYTCGHCATNEACHHINGVCADGCDAGWHGTTCQDDECTNSRWGDACNETCGTCHSNAPCDHVNGTCHLGCETGWEGHLCTQAMKLVDEGGSMAAGLIAGLAVGIIIFVALVLVGILIWRRKHRGKSDTRDTEAVSSNANFVNIESNALHRVNLSITDQKNNHGNSSVDCDEAIYNNILPENIQRTIRVTEMRDYCGRYCTDSEQLSTDFKIIPYGLQYDCLVANRIQNKKKNRYKDMYTYDKNRVRLPGDPYSDYINASFVNGYNQSNGYIASQGAMKTTTDDIWRMVWSQNVYNIVMLTGCMENGMLKCVQYWPSEGEAKYGAISVTLISEVARSEFTTRVFLCKEEETGSNRHVTQYHYTAWPDKDVPDTPVSLVRFWRMVKRGDHIDRKPWLVHCSAGVGRTGTFISLDYLHDQAESEQQVSVFDCVNFLRTQRVNMVQTKVQYVFLHRAVLEAICPTGKSCPSENFPELYRDLQTDADGTTSSKLQVEFENLEREVADDGKSPSKPMAGADRTGELDNYAASKLPENRMKIHDLAVLPQDRYRPYLTTAVPGCNNYINATVLRSYNAGDNLIITQHPLANSVVDFVRLIWDYNVYTVVAMGGQTEPDPQTEYWSDTADTDPFTVTSVHEATSNYFRTRTVRIEHLGEVRECQQLEYTGWPDTGDVHVPTDAASILELLAELDTTQHTGTSSPIVVSCMNGAERSGLFCVLWVVLQGMKADGEVAIAETIRLMWVRRNGIVPNYAQYKFCHEVIEAYMETFEVYVNVT